MAIEGVYNVKLKTPLGFMKAVVELHEENNTCSGQIVCLDSKAPFENGEVNGNQFKFNAVMPTPIGKIKFDMEGSIDGDVFQATTNSTLGHIVVTGERA